MVTKALPLSAEQLDAVLQQHDTPFYLYFEDQIRANARALKKAFSWAPGFKQYFAVKATPTPVIVDILRQEGLGVDCSSLSELVLAERLGIRGENIMFSSNFTPQEEYRKAAQLGAIINLDDAAHIGFVSESIGLPDTLSIRYNPGSLKAGNQIIGRPEDSKFGSTREQIMEAMRFLTAKGVKRLGLHTMVASNELDENYFADTAEIMFEFALELARKHGVTIDFINLGGGIGVAYRPEETAPSFAVIGEKIRQKYTDIITGNGLPDIRLFLEMGRSVTASAGYLISRVEHVKKTFKTYVGIDANMANLMRPGMYGAYHHIEVVGKEGEAKDVKCDVVGSLCENNDKFAIDRMLPPTERGDVVVIFDVGAHGHSMGFNYNGKLRSAELLYTAEGAVRVIRRAEAVDDYLKTAVFP